MAGQSPNMEQFEAYFQRADVDRDGRISGNEAVAFLQASNLPRQVLAQIWTYADQNRVGFLGRQEFYNALKLVTVAQSKLDLTPELVKGALYGPASDKIPAPQINLASLPSPQSNVRSGSSTAQLVGPPNSTQGVVAAGLQGSSNQQSQVSRSPQPPHISSGFQPHLGVSTQGMHGTGSVPASNSSNSFNLPGDSTNGTRAGIPSQVSDRSLSPSVTEAGFDSTPQSSTQPKGPEATGLLQSASSKPNDITLLNSHLGKEDSKSLSTVGNGIGSDSVFGDVFSVTTPQLHKNSTVTTYPTGSTSALSAGNLSSSRDQPTTVKTSAVYQSPTVPAQQFQSTGKANQHVLGPKSAFPVAAGQSQSPWPRMNQSDVQKYSRVFVQVDTDRDGKITGEQARNLFLSWRLPREILKKVWDLSDQDNDSMLSLREFCIALYLMERYREGHPLPVTLPTSVIFDETLFPASTQPASAHGNMSWRPATGLQQTQGPKSARLITNTVGGKPPRPVPVPQPDEPIQQNAKVPVLEKHLLDQLSTEEQDSLNKKLEEAKDAEKKVADLEKEISEARQKIQFYHAKMQELILYKSRCDNRLNEISERVVADKREVESLAKKYEEKYKQTGDVASKLTLEEATFRDIQEKKMELYRSIVKLEQENADGVKDRASQIQSDLDQLVKALNERCKTYGLRGKPTSLVELPYGWQPGIAATAADWDEVWDKFEDEGFTFVKELTLEVQNVIAPPKPKSAVIREKLPSLDNSDAVKTPSKTDDETDMPISREKVPENEKPNTHNLEQIGRSPPDSPAGSNAAVSPSKAVYDLRKFDNMTLNGSPRAFAFDTQSEYGAESVLSMEKGFDEPSWGSFDIHYDSDAAWDSNPANSKDAEHEKHGEGFIFSGDDWGLNPIRTGSKGTETTLPKQGPFFDSVPSTPMSYAANSPHADNFFSRNSPFAFADSVPSTPLYNSTTSPRRFSGGSEEHHAYDSFSRFDSFNLHDGGPFSSRDSLGRFDSFNMNDSGPLTSREMTRFDSMRSSKDSDFDQGYFAPREPVTRFDSFRSTADSDYNFGQFPPGPTLSRFDSMLSTKDSEFGHSFPSFDDPADPFGSSGPFQTPRKDDAGNLFGSSQPFKTSFDAQTPRSDYDSWRAF